MTSILLQPKGASPPARSASLPQTATRSSAKKQDPLHFSAKTQALDLINYFYLYFAYISIYIKLNNSKKFKQIETYSQSYPQPKQPIECVLAMF
jgi:hypothetical protein